MNSCLAILVVVIQLIFPLFPSANLQVQGSISANGIPIAYQMELNTEEQTVEMNLTTITSTIFHLAADLDGIKVMDKAGSYGYSADDLLQRLNGLREHKTNAPLSWAALELYLTDGELLEDARLLMKWLSSTQMALPEPERIEENGEIYYQVALNGPDILTAITNALDSLSTPSQASQELAQMHIWDALGIEPIPNLRYVRYLIDQQSENIWNSHLFWQYFSHFNLAIKWSDDVDDDNTTFLTLPLPSKIYLNASFDDNGNQVVWDIRLSENELRGAVYFGDLQTAAFTLVDSQQDMTLHVDYCVFDYEHYDVTIRWRKDQKSPTFQAKLVKNHKYHDLSWPGIPLISIRFSSNEIIFSMQDDHCQNKVQGSLYWLDDRYYLNIRLGKQTSGPSEIYEFHAETNPLNKGTSALNVKWSCDVFSENLDQTAKYGGILDCTYTAVLQSDAAPIDENPAEVNTIEP